MKKLLLLLFTLLLPLSTADAQLSLTAYRDVVLSSTGTPITTAAITVFLPNTTTKPPGGIFSTAVGGSLSNPFAVDSLGNYTFYVIPGVYDILISIPGLADTTIEDVHLASSSSYLLTGSTAAPSGCTVGEYYYNTTTGQITFCGAAGLSVPGASTLTGNITFGGSLIPSATGQDIGSATKRPDIFAEDIQVGDINGVLSPDGSQFTKDSTGLQAAIDEVEAANGGMIFLPCGTYPITSALTVTMPGNNLGFKMVGAGICTILQPSTAMTVLTVDMGASNYQSLYLADFAFDLNSTDSTAMSFVGSGQKGVVERIYVDNNDGAATANIITIDNTSHTMRFEDVRIRGNSATADGISVSSNAVILDGLDITGCKSAVIIPSATSVNALTIQNSRLDSNVNAFKIDGTSALGINFIHNHAEDNSASHLDIAGLDASTNRVFGLTIRDNYFTGMDLAAEDGITLENLDGSVIERNHFKGTGSNAEAVTYLTSSVTSVFLNGNTVDAVLSSMTGSSGVPLEVDDVTLTQTSKQFGAASIASTGSITTASGNIGSLDTTNPVVFFGSRAAAGGVAWRAQTTNSSDVLTTRIEITGKEDTAELRFLNSDLVANPKEGTFSNVPRWLLKIFEHTDIVDAATAGDFVLWTLPANTMIHDVVGEVVTEWEAAAGLSAAVCSVGTAGGSANDLALDDDFFTTAQTVYELHDGTASGGKGALLYDGTDKFAPYMFVAGGNIEIQCDLTGDDHADTNAGQARIQILVSQPLGNTTTEAN